MLVWVLTATLSSVEADCDQVTDWAKLPLVDSDWARCSLRLNAVLALVKTLWLSQTWVLVDCDALPLVLRLMATASLRLMLVLACVLAISLNNAEKLADSLRLAMRLCESYSLRRRLSDRL